MALVRSILTVCVGNICRSPVAERLLRQRLPEVQVGSAGIGALVGKPMDPSARDWLERQGLSGEGHRARQLNAELLRWADLVLVMEKGHKNYIGARFPASLGKVHLLGRWQEERDIADPYKKSQAFFDQVLEQVAEGVDAWVERLR